MANILIAGCGDIGCLLGKKLSLQGHTVFGLRRKVDALPKYWGQSKNNPLL